MNLINYSSNPYVCGNTEDKVFLLSYAEVSNRNYGFTSDETRQMLTSDYARAVGVWMSTSQNYYGSGEWWLRSPASDASYYSRKVWEDGSFGTNYVNVCYGIAPALRIVL